MKIIIPRIPEATTKMDLRRFADGQLNQRFNLPFTQRPRIVSCDILRITDPNGIIEYHGLLTILPDRAGEWLAAHLMGTRLNGKIIVTREYVDRKGMPSNIDPEYDRRRKGLHVAKQGYLRTEAVA